MVTLGSWLAAKIEAFWAAQSALHPKWAEGFRGHPLCRLVLAQYTGGVSRVGHVGLVVTPDGHVVCGRAELGVFPAAKVYPILAFGESDYVCQHVFMGAQKAHDAKSGGEAAALAAAIIAATEARSTVIPIPSGVGGQPTVVLLSETHPAQFLARPHPRPGE